MAQFREFRTSSGKRVFAGKTAENNEELVEQAGKDEIVLHTKEPGSPFVNIKSPEKDVKKRDINEAGIICSPYSQDLNKSNKNKDIVVHVIKGKDMYKEKKMKTGTFGVRNKKEIKIKKQDIKDFEKDLNEQEEALEKFDKVNLA